MKFTRKTFGIARPTAKWVAATIGVLLTLSCGGGGGDGIVGSGGTGTDSAPAVSDNGATVNKINTVVRGPITGFGSIIVNGVTYDDRTARLVRDDQTILTRADLRLGMFVELSGQVDLASQTGTANNVVITSELRGEVQNRTATTFDVLGVTVSVDVNTVLENAANILNGDLVEVYGIYDDRNRSLLATRVEKKPVVVHKVRGLVSNLDTTAKLFSIGNVLVDYTNATSFSGLANGAEVKVWGPMPAPVGAWQITDGLVLVPVVVNNDIYVDFKAVIDQFTSVANFRVAGFTVDASNATFKDGTAADLAAGRIVEIEGDVRGGILRATSVEIEGTSGSSNSGSGSSGSGSSGSGSSGSGSSGSGSSGSGSSGSGSSGSGSSGSGSSGSGSDDSDSTESSSSGSGSSGSGSSGSGSSGSGSSGSGSSGSGSSGSGSSGSGSSGSGSSGSGSSGSGSSGSGSSGSGSSGGSDSSGSGSGKDVLSADQTVPAVFQVKGTVSTFVSTASFIVRNTRLDASGKAIFERGSLSDLADGACVWAQGRLAPSSSGSILAVDRLRVLEGGCD